MTVTGLAELIISWGVGFGVKVPPPMAKLIARKAFSLAADLPYAQALELEKAINPLPPEKVVYLPDSKAYPEPMEFAQILLEGQNQEAAIKHLWDDLHEWMRINNRRLAYAPELVLKTVHEPWQSYEKDANKVKVVMLAKVLPLEQEPAYGSVYSFGVNHGIYDFPKYTSSYASNYGMITYNG